MNTTTPNSTSLPVTSKSSTVEPPTEGVTMDASGQDDQEEGPSGADAVNGVDVVLPIIPAPQDPTPTPPAQHDLDTVVLPQSHTGRLDLSEPILEALTNPA